MVSCIQVPACTVELFRFLQAHGIHVTQACVAAEFVALGLAIVLILNLSKTKK